MEKRFVPYSGLVATLVRETKPGQDLPVIAHDGRSDRQHMAGFALDNLSEATLISLIQFIGVLLLSDPNRWVAIYQATPGTVLLNQGNRLVVHGFKPVKTGNYLVKIGRAHV